MNWGRLAPVWSGVAIAAIGLGFGLFRWVGPATTPPSTAPASTDVAATITTAPAYVVFNCLNQSQVRPRTYTLACADGGTGLRLMRWTSWIPGLASGAGIEWQNDCVPNCAAGHVRDYPVLAVLWGSAPVPGHPAQRRYTEVTIIYQAARPAVFVDVNGKAVATHPVTQTMPLAP